MANIARIVAIGLFLTAGSAWAKETTEDFSVSGWGCPHCCGRTEKSISEVKGVKSAKANFDKKIVSVVYEDTVANADQIRKAIEKAGHSCPRK